MEADANLAKRQETVLRAAQNVGASRLRQDPAALPGVLAFFEAHKLDVGADKQKAFDAQWRGALVDAAVQGQMERDPQGLLLTLENRRSRQDLEGRSTDTGGNAGTPAANADAIDPLGAHLAEHPLASALTPEEVARYLPQVRAGVYTAESNQRAALVQQARVAEQSYLSTGKAERAPDEAAFIASFGLDEGKQRFAQLQAKKEEGEQYINMRALPTPVLLEMQGNAQRGLRATAQANPDTLGSPAPAGADTASPFGLRLPGADPADPAYAARSRESGITQSVVSRILADRRDPIQAGQEAGAYGITPADLSSPQAALQSAATRVPIAGMVAGDYGTEPVLYSQAEFAQLAKTLQDLPGPARAAWFAEFTRSIGDPALVQSTLRGLSVHSRAIALAGQLQFEESQVPGTGSADAWGGDGKLNAAQLIFTGDALIKADGVAMPPESETRGAFRAAFGDTYADAPGEEEMRYEGALAAYAALGQQAGDNSGKFDAGRWKAAMRLATNGSGTAREVGLDGGTDQRPISAGSNDAPANTAPYVDPEVDHWDLQGKQPEVGTVGKEGAQGAWGIATKLAGPDASQEQINRIKNQLLQLNPELAGTVKAGQRYYVPEEGTPENQALARRDDARWKSALDQEQRAKEEREAAEIKAQNNRELNRVESLESQAAVTSNETTGASASEAGTADQNSSTQKVPSRRPHVIAPAYLTKSQIRDLDRALYESQAQGDSEEKQQEILEIFKQAAFMQAALQPVDGSNHASREQYRELITPDVRLSAIGRIARDAEQLFSMHNRWARPADLGLAELIGDAQLAGGSSSAGGFTTSAFASLGTAMAVFALSPSPPPAGKSNNPNHNDPKPIYFFERDGVKYPVYTYGDAAKLSPGTGIIFVLEGPDQRTRSGNLNAAQTFEAGTSGAMSDRVTGRRIVPGVRYTNTITEGTSVKRLDGFDQVHFVPLIDRKYESDSMKSGRKSNTDMQRFLEAARQNPAIPMSIEVPDDVKEKRMVNRMQGVFGPTAGRIKIRKR